YGAAPRWGIVAFASSLDQAGPIGRTVRDNAILLRSMAGHDPRDTTSVDLPVPDYEAAIGASVKGMRIGIPREYRLEGLSPQIDALWNKGIAMLREAGAEIVDISLPHTRYALPAYYIVAPAECSSNLARYDGVRYGMRVAGSDISQMYENTRAAGFGREVKRRIMIGTYVLSAGYYDAYYVRAQQIRTLIKRDFEAAFAEGITSILTPATPSAAFGIGEKLNADPVEMYLNDVFTVTVNMAGLPGIALPAGRNDEGLPLGLQLIGRPFDESTLFSLAEVIEQAPAALKRPRAGGPDADRAADRGVFPQGARISFAAIGGVIGIIVLLRLTACRICRSGAANGWGSGFASGSARFAFSSRSALPPCAAEPAGLKSVHQKLLHCIADFFGLASNLNVSRKPAFRRVPHA
ncbi:MAG: Asp-tRNA(Asn)/Glu-tRNA(Gln) amidotransferase subunit GatA, partial [Candidatus Competibacteraceae bacterium]|nr:Asp-tRNA(Asn)/Glu-tRNA(Gln) amidotransferase subunit GatA [Candidatus Competibacteraceae bacterium]